MPVDTLNGNYNASWMFPKFYFPNSAQNFGGGFDTSMFNMPWNSPWNNSLSNNILGNSAESFDFSKMFNNYSFGNGVMPQYYPNFSPSGTTAADDKKAREKDIKKINKDINAEIEKIEKVEKIKENNQQKLEKMTAEKNAKDEKLGFWNGVKSLGKGALKQLGNLIGDYDKDGKWKPTWGKVATTAMFVGAGIGLTMIPGGWVIAGLATAAFGLTSGVQAVKGYANACSASTVEDKKHALEDMGEGIAGVGLAFGPSALGALKMIKEGESAASIVKLAGFNKYDPKAVTALKIGGYSEGTYNTINDMYLEQQRKKEQGKDLEFQNKLVNVSTESIKKSNEKIDADVKKLADMYKIDTEDYDRKTILEKIEAAKAEEAKKTRNETEG